MRSFLALIATLGSVLVATTGTAAAQTSPYSGTGYDISYPQCSGAALPAGRFGIVGVNYGRPFTLNPCFSRELAHATATSMPLPSLYINTAYSGAYRKKVTAYCSQQLQSMAWQIGCSEADIAYLDAGRPSTTSVLMWWLDVELGNSWSSSNLALNQAAIQGATDRLTQAGFHAGVYSTASSWAAITGSSPVYTPRNTEAAWLAGSNGACGSSFDAAPLWLSQYVNGFDFDNAC